MIDVTAQQYQAVGAEAIYLVDLVAHAILDGLRSSSPSAYIQYDEDVRQSITIDGDFNLTSVAVTVLTAIAVKIKEGAA